MFIVNNYFFAVTLCIITMLCWGSWGNTQKLAAKTWRYELYYWDYVIGILLISTFLGLTLGSFGEGGRSFFTDLNQADIEHLTSAFIGGVVFNAANILLSTSISLTGMAVAFPIGVGLALVLGVIINYFALPIGDPYLLFGGVTLIVAAILLNSFASSKVSRSKTEKAIRNKGIVIAVIAGVLMSLFFRFVSSSMDLTNFYSPAVGMLTPYSAFFVFSLGIFASNIVLNTWIMKKPFVGEPVTFKTYFSGSFKTHFVGILGGVIWGVGTAFSYISAQQAGPAISYALGQGAPMIAALWGVFIWKEFSGGSSVVMKLLTLMFICFLLGLALIVVAGM